MQSHTSWSISLPGRWGGLHVRLHMFFLLFAACTLFLSWRVGEPGSSEFVWIAWGSLAILLVSVVLHELGHYWAAVRLGGGGDEIVVGPLGGLTSMRVPREPSAEFAVHLAGPLVNLAICMLCGGVLFFTARDRLLDLLHPLAPSGLIDGPVWLQAFKLCFWINWVLLLANLLPAFPFDGGRAMRAALSSLRPDAAARHAAFIVANLAKIAAIGLLILAWFVSDSQTNPTVPVWFSLVLLAIFLFFSAKHEEERAQESESDPELFGYDFSQGFTSLERSSPQSEEAAGPITRWLETRRKSRLQRQRASEVEDERRVDEVLMQLHEHGMASLSDDDRSLLKRVSARYRQRNSEKR